MKNQIGNLINIYLKANAFQKLKMHFVRLY